MKRIKIGRLEFDVTPFEKTARFQNQKQPPRFTQHNYGKTFYLWDCESQTGVADPRPPRIDVKSEFEPFIENARTQAEYEQKKSLALRGILAKSGLGADAFKRELLQKFRRFNPPVPYNKILDPFKAANKLYLRFEGVYLTVAMMPVGTMPGVVFLNHIPVSVRFITSFIGTCPANGTIRPDTPTFVGRRGLTGTSKEMFDEYQDYRLFKDLQDLGGWGGPFNHDDLEPDPDEWDEWDEEEFQEWLEEEFENEVFDDFLDEMWNAFFGDRPKPEPEGQ